MTDSDTESFHSAASSLADLEDNDLGKVNMGSGRDDMNTKANMYATAYSAGRCDEVDVVSGHFESKLPNQCEASEWTLMLKGETAAVSVAYDRNPAEAPKNGSFAHLHYKFDHKLEKRGITERAGADENSDMKSYFRNLGRPRITETNGEQLVKDSREISEAVAVDNLSEDRVGRCKLGNGKTSEMRQKTNVFENCSGTFCSRQEECDGKVIRNVDGGFGENIAKKIADSAEGTIVEVELGGKTGAVYDGWDDWELDTSEKSFMGIVDQNASMKMELSEGREVLDEQKQSSDDLKPKTVQGTKQAKSFWDWAEFGEVVTVIGEGITSISNVVESSLGLPAPEELANCKTDEKPSVTKEVTYRNDNSSASYGKFLAGFGANVVTGSLDVLETLGKKTFEKLTIPKQGTEKRRFIFEPEKGQNLSQVLKELRESHPENTVAETSCVTKRELTFMDFFVKSSGMVHLEGLEMLSRNHLRKISAQRRREVDDIFAEDLKICLEDFQENEEDFVQCFSEILSATGLPYNGTGLIDCHRHCRKGLERLPDCNDQILEFFLECLAKFTAQSVQSIHKMGQLLLITSTAVRHQPFSDFYSLIGREIVFFSNQFANHISATDHFCEEGDEFVTTIFLAAGDAFSYIQQSFRLLRPLLIH